MLSKDIEVIPVRDLSYEEAEKEIVKYLQNAGKRKVYTTEIVEKLRVDIELAADILHKWRNEKCKDSCAEDGFQGFTSYTCPVTSCIYNNYLVR